MRIYQQSREPNEKADEVTSESNLGSRDPPSSHETGRGGQIAGDAGQMAELGSEWHVARVTSDVQPPSMTDQAKWAVCMYWNPPPQSKAPLGRSASYRVECEGRIGMINMQNTPSSSVVEVMEEEEKKSQREVNFGNYRTFTESLDVHDIREQVSTLRRPISNCTANVRMNDLDNSSAPVRGATASPFGASTFGKTTTTGFTAPAFGQTSTSLFGSGTQTSGGLFGQTAVAPVFGQPQTTQPSFGFGANTTSGGLFGNQQNANTSGGLFGSSGSSAFGQNKPAFGGFGSTTGTGLFGQQQQQPAQGTTSLFGQSATSTGGGIFGTGGFGGTMGNQTMGTTVKFNPVTGSDTMVKNGVSQTINTRHHCITCMKEYESKSLEELRFEDYSANRKGPQQGSQQVGLFGAQATAPLFGAASTSANTGSIFSDNKSLFGASTSLGGFGASTGGFGSTNQQTSSLFGKPANQFGSLATTSGTGFTFNTATTSNNLFGAPAQAKPFGTVAPQTSNLFGTQTSQPTAGFGAPSTGFSGFNTQPNQSIGLFNQNKTPFGMATSSGFTFGQNTATNSGGLFGQKPPGTAGFGQPTFGSNTTTGFGTAGSSLFNQPFKQPSTGFTFNQGGTPNTGLGLNLGGQSSLFNNPATKPGGLFNNTGGIFSGGTLGTGTNLFGTSGGLGGTSLNLGGNSMLGGVGAGIQTNQQSTNQIHQQILALAAMPFGDSPLFKNLQPASGKTDELIRLTAPAQKNSVNATQYRVSPHSSSRIRVAPIIPTPVTNKKSLFEGLEEGESSSPVEPFVSKGNLKRLTLKPHSDTSPRAVPKARFEMEGSNRNEFDEPWLANAVFKRKVASKAKENGPVISDSEEPENRRRGLESPTEDALTDLFPRRSPASPQVVSPGEDSNKENVVNISSSSSDDSQELNESSAVVLESQVPHATGIVLHRVGYYTIPSLDDLTSLINDDASCVVEQGFTIGREGYGNVYWPGTFNVAGLNLDEIVHFRHKEVVVYPDDEKKPPLGEGLNRKAQVTLDRVWPMDKARREPITDPERLIQMNYEGKLRKVCAKLGTRFLDYRPQTGSWVFKVDHFSKYGLSDSDDDDDDLVTSDPKKLKTGAPLQKLQQLQPPPKEVIQGLETSLSLQQRGLALLEDDELMEDGPLKEQELNDEIDFDVEKMDSQSPTSQLARELGTSTHKVQLMKASFFMDDNDLQTEDYMEMTHIPTGRLMQIHPNVLMEERRLQLGDLEPPIGISMLRSRFSGSELSPRHKVAINVKGVDVTPVLSAVKGPTQRHYPPLRMEKPRYLTLHHRHEMVPLKSSTVSRVEGPCFSSPGLQLGRSFRAGWGREGTLLTLTTQRNAAVVNLRGSLKDLDSYLGGREPGDRSQCIVQRLRLTGGDQHASVSFRETVEGHLRIQLNHSVKKIEGGCPALSPATGLDALHAHCIQADTLGDSCPNEPYVTYCLQAWELCVALWGSLPELEEYSDNKHHTTNVRRNALSQWLEGVLSALVKEEAATTLNRPNADRAQDEAHIPAVLSQLSGNLILDACNLLQDSSDFNAAILVAQSAGSWLPRQHMEQQLINWSEVSADKFMSPERLQMFSLVAGVPLFSSAHGTINVCKDLDWKRAFGVHLWYMCSQASSITDALLKYEKAFDSPESSNRYAHPPDPLYFEGDGLQPETSSGRAVWDLCFHLLKLYSSRSHPLDQLLNPATHTSDPLDYRLCWFLFQVLTALGYTHLSDYSAALLHTSFASQLEGLGLWHWAVFVLLHLKNQPSRQAAVQDMIDRHVELSEDQEYREKEEFLVEKLNIPSAWIHRAKATLALVHNRYKDAAWYMINAGLWKESHQIIMKHIAADAIANENYKYLEDLLAALVPTERSGTIAGWSSTGQLLWDFLQVLKEMEGLLSQQGVSYGYHMEGLRSKLMSLCPRINMLPCHSAKDRLCQSEIAQHVVHLVSRLVLVDVQGNVSSEVLVRLVEQLPLPKDFARIELRHAIDYVDVSVPPDDILTPFQTHCFTENLEAPRIEPRISRSVARNSDHNTIEVEDRESYKITRYSWEGEEKFVIDHFVMDEEMKSDLKYRGITVSLDSNHRVLVADIKGWELLLCPGTVSSGSLEGLGTVSSGSLEGLGTVSYCYLEGLGTVGSCSLEGPGMIEGLRTGPFLRCDWGPHIMCDIAGMDQGPPDSHPPTVPAAQLLVGAGGTFSTPPRTLKGGPHVLTLHHISWAALALDRNEITQGVRDGSAHVLRCLKVWYDLPSDVLFVAINLMDRFLTRMKVLPKHMACISVSAFHMAARVLANRRENGERFLIPDARDLVSISQCRCTLGDMTRMEGIIAGKLSEEIPVTALDFLCLFHRMLASAGPLAFPCVQLEILACDAACVNFRASEVALALLCWQLDRLNTRQDPSPGVDMVRLLSTAVELQKLCKISDAGFLRCHEVVASVLTLYDAQRQMPHRQRLVWKLSQRTLRYLRPTDKLSSLLPTIDEQGQLSLPLRIRSGSLSSEESTDSEKEDPLSEWGSYGRVDWSHNVMHALPEESNILNNRFYNALID
uniref:Nuclear pore complex protein Nup98-Nup96 n=1 Tax=Timema monikensis TaxID=170555 RepID=A0A7R9E2D6_9NEOP|nr:unnamed protein product [Timema monikensis]